MASILYPPVRIRDIPGPQPGQFGVVRQSNDEFHPDRIEFDRFSSKNLIDPIKI